jgi:hypothetical protein
MIHTSSLYETCHDLFTDYPLAATVINRSGTVRSMVLMLQEGADAGYFILSQYCDKGRSSFSLWVWPAGEIVDIEDGASTAIPDAAVNAVTHGTPIPRDGSLFGWACGDGITALIAVYAEYTPASPEPSWAVMPLAGIPEAQWPPFTGEPLFGNWSWEHFRSAKIVSLADFIAGTLDTVFWVDTKAALGSDSCVVAHDMTSPEGYTLRRGCYVYYQTLREGMLVPSLRSLLADTSKIDLATRFQPH